MKYSDKYPPPSGDDTELPPQTRIFGLHPLVWVFVVVMGIAAFAAANHLEYMDWDRGPLSDEADGDDDHADERDD